MAYYKAKDLRNYHSLGRRTQQMYSKLVCTIATPQEMQHDRHHGMVFPRQEYAKALTLGQLICFIQEASIPCYICHDS